MTYKTFETEYRVRPDDIVMYQHVHNSKYFDYVMAARYEQMEICYGMGMEKFFELGYGWLVSKAYIDYKRALVMGDYFTVTTGIESINEKNCRVKFVIKNKASNKVSCDGWFEFVLIELKTSKGILIPADIIKHYAI
jgi:acyl-CoA thioester hydrolase/thioesterase-3